MFMGVFKEEWWLELVCFISQKETGSISATVYMYIWYRRECMREDPHVCFRSDVVGPGGCNSATAD